MGTGRQGVSAQFSVKLKFPEDFFFFYQKQKEKIIEQILLTLDLFYSLPLEKSSCVMEQSGW